MMYQIESKHNKVNISSVNIMVERRSLRKWSTKPNVYACYALDDKRVTTWLGTTIGIITSRSQFCNNFGGKTECIRFKGTNGAEYYGRKSTQFDLLIAHKAKKAGA